MPSYFEEGRPLRRVRFRHEVAKALCQCDYQQNFISWDLQIEIYENFVFGIPKLEVVDQINSDNEGEYEGRQWHRDRIE